MALLGSSVDPRLFLQDYSGFTRAAEIQAQGMQNLGASIGGAIEQYGEIKKKNAQLTGEIKGIERQIDSAINLFPERKSQLEAMKTSISDPNKSLIERYGEASTYKDLIDNELNFMKAQTSMRAVAVQERQMGMRPAYFGGGQSPARSGGGYGGGVSRSVDMSRGDAALANQPGAIPLPPGPDDLVLPGESGSDVFSIQQKIQRAQQLNIPAEKINYIVSGVKSALSNPSEASQSTVQSFDKNLSSLIANAEKNFEPAKDAKGQPQVVISVDEAGNESRFTKTKGGNLINEYGEVLTPQGQPISQPQYNQLDVESINRALNMDEGVLPPLPDETSMTQPIGTPEEQARVQRMVDEGQGRAMAQNMPQGAVATDRSLAYTTPQPQPEQKSAGLGLMAQESQARQEQASGEELRKLTELTPRKSKLYESALNQAYQDPKTAPSQDVVDELKLQLLMQPEAKGPQVMSEEEYNRRNVSLVNKAQKRVGDRSASEVILSHFDVIQQLANHPEGSQVFGKSIPESKLRELASTEGSVLALYNNLKGRDLVQAMRDIKAQSGTAAGMSEKETMALQRAVNELDRAQDWKSAQKTLMRIASGTIRAGKKLGLDESVFEVMPMTPATDTTPASKRQTTKAAEILDNPESVPMFRDEVQYFNRVNNLKSRLQGGPSTGTTQPALQAQPQSQPSAVTPMGLESLFFPTR